MVFGKLHYSITVLSRVLQYSIFMVFNILHYSINRLSRVLQYSIYCLILALFTASSPTLSQTKAQAEAALRQMSPAEIDQKLKEYGISRQEAQARAAQLGIDLNAYLQTRGGSASTATGVSGPPAVLKDVPPAPDTAKGLETAVVRPKAEAGERPWYVSTSGLPYFGYEVFDGVPSAFEPTATGPADPEYVIGPEDVLKLAVWGEAELQYELTVDKEGKTFIPTFPKS